MNIPTNLKLISSGSAPNAATLQKGEMAFGRVPNTGNIRLFVNDNNSVTELALGEYKEILYLDLLTKITANELIPGEKYLITDYKTVYKQPETNTTITDADIEPIVVTALSTNTLEPIAYSPSNPKDIIYYDINNDTAKYEWTASSGGRGVIYRRIDANNNDLPYDHTKIKFRRWSVDYNSITQWTSGETCNFGNIRRNSGTANNRVYICVKNNVTENPTTSNSVNWLVILENAAGTNKMYWLNNQDGYIYTYIDSQFGYLDYIQLPVLDSIDCYTFHDLQNNANGNLYNNVRDNVIDNYVSSGIRKLGNNVFIGYGTSIYFNYNTIGNYFNYNTIGNYFNYNTIGNNFYYNTIGNNFNYNTIGNYFNYNTIGNNFYYNTIGNNFYSNTIGNNFYYNTIGNYFNYNTVLDNVNNNGSGKDLTSYTYLYNKYYSATIQQSGNYSYIVTYYDSSNTLITQII
jgi:hypothetical protein